MSTVTHCDECGDPCSDPIYLRFPIEAVPEPDEDDEDDETGVRHFCGWECAAVWVFRVASNDELGDEEEDDTAVDS